MRKIGNFSININIDNMDIFDEAIYVLYKHGFYTDEIAHLLDISLAAVEYTVFRYFYF